MDIIQLDLTLSTVALEEWFGSRAGLKAPVIAVNGAHSALCLYLTENGVDGELAKSMLGVLGYHREHDTLHLKVRGSGEDFYKACRILENLSKNSN